MAQTIWRIEAEPKRREIADQVIEESRLAAFEQSSEGNIVSSIDWTKLCGSAEGRSET
jgi:hypothetical protein